MDILDIFLKKYSYKFPKGYPDMNNEQDVLLMESLLSELGVKLNEEDSESTPELDPIIKDTLSKDDKLTKIKSFTELAKLTYEQYDLGNIKTVFPTLVNIIPDYSKYATGSFSNKGKEIENVLMNYSIAQGVESKSVSGKGQDISIGDKIIEVKSERGNTINTQLQTSFYTNNPNKFYAFVSNTAKDNIDVRIVASELLYNLSLGKEVTDEIKKTGTSDIIIKQIEDGLMTLDFKKMIISSILTGKTTEDTKSFFIGNEIRCRFVIYIEPK